MKYVYIFDFISVLELGNHITLFFACGYFVTLHITYN